MKLEPTTQVSVSPERRGPPEAAQGAPRGTGAPGAVLVGISGPPLHALTHSHENRSCDVRDGLLESRSSGPRQAMGRMHCRPHPLGSGVPAEAAPSSPAAHSAAES